jgi:glycosyltransferase involved in cell wall biosynthesis
MRIHYLSASRLDSRQANSVHVMHMCAAMASLGHKVTLFCQTLLDEATPFERYGVTRSFRIVGAQASRIPIVGGVLYARNLLEKAKQFGEPDIWYGRHVYSTSFVALRGRPFILEQHGVHRRAATRSIIHWMSRSTNLRAFVVISEALRDDCVKAYPKLDARRLLVAHDAALPLPPAKAKFEKGQRFNVGYVGHLYAGKGMEIVLPLAERVPEALFHVVGGTEFDIRRWQNRGLPSNLTLHGFVQHASIPAYLASFDAVLLPNQRRVMLDGEIGDIGKWTSPLKMFEYMAAGLPIIASSIPVLREVLRDGENAVLADPENIEEWERALRRLITDNVVRETIAGKAREDFLEHYTWTKRAQRILASAIV